MPDDSLEARLELFKRVRDRLVAEVGRLIIGQRAVIDQMLATIFVRGHSLLVGVPGLAKTMMVRGLAGAMDLEFKRIQFTPDLMPADITGTDVIDQAPDGRRERRFLQGPVFANILLADEVNRATPRTQSALLEGMGERQVTVDGITYPLQRPFLVLATENPIEFEGTFPLPEAQLDRFFLKLSVGYPDTRQEALMLRNLQRQHPIERIEQVVDGMSLPELARQVWEIHVDDSVVDYIVGMVQATRQHPDLTLGASPRGSLALFKGAQALAAIRGRDFVKPDDVKELARPALSHRLIVKPESALRGRTAAQVLDEVLSATTVEIGEV